MCDEKQVILRVPKSNRQDHFDYHSLCAFQCQHGPNMRHPLFYQDLLLILLSNHDLENVVLQKCPLKCADRLSAQVSASVLAEEYTETALVNSISIECFDSHNPNPCGLENTPRCSIINDDVPIKGGYLHCSCNTVSSIHIHRIECFSQRADAANPLFLQSTHDAATARTRAPSNTRRPPFTTSRTRLRPG